MHVVEPHPTQLGEELNHGPIAGTAAGSQPCTSGRSHPGFLLRSAPEDRPGLHGDSEPAVLWPLVVNRHQPPRDSAPRACTTAPWVAPRTPRHCRLGKFTPSILSQGGLRPVRVTAPQFDRPRRTALAAHPSIRSRRRRTGECTRSTEHFGPPNWPGRRAGPLGPARHKPCGVARDTSHSQVSSQCQEADNQAWAAFSGLRLGRASPASRTGGGYRRASVPRAA